MSDVPGTTDGIREKTRKEFSFQSERLPELNTCLFVETQECFTGNREIAPVERGFNSLGGEEKSKTKSLRERLKTETPVIQSPVYTEPNSQSDGPTFTYKRPEPRPENPNLSSLDTFSQSEPLSGTYAIDEVHDFMKNNFRWFDENGDRQISDKELSDGLEELTVNHNSDAVGKMVSALSDYSTGSDFKRRTLEEITLRHTSQTTAYKENRQRQKEAVPNYYAMTELALERFDEIDLSKNNRLSREELREARDSANNATERELFDGLLDNYRYVAYGSVGLPASRYTYDNYIDRSKLFRFIDQQYGWHYESEHGIIANFKRAKSDFDKFGFVDVSELTAREHLYGEVGYSKKWWQFW